MKHIIIAISLIIFYSLAVHSQFDYDLMINRGKDAEESEQYNMAQYYFERAIQIDSTNPIAYVNLGYLYFKKQKANVALEYFNQALSLDSLNIYALFGLAYFYENTFHSFQAVETYDKIISIESSNEYAYVGIASIYSEADNFYEAIHYYNMAIEAALKKGNHDYVGFCYYMTHVLKNELGDNKGGFLDLKKSAQYNNIPAQQILDLYRQIGIDENNIEDYNND